MPRWKQPTAYENTQALLSQLRESLDKKPESATEFKIEEIRRDELEALTIQNDRKQFVRITLNDPQIILLEAINESIRNGEKIEQILLKARQFGGSTFYVCVLYLMIKKYGYRGIIIAQDVDAANTLFKKFKYCLTKDNDPDKPFIVKKGVREYTLSNGAEIWIGSAEGKSIRSQTNNFVLCTELPQWPKSRVEEVLTAALNTVPDAPGNFVIFESTAKGMEEFHDRYNKAKELDYEGNKVNNFKALFISWLQIAKYRKEFPTIQARDSFEANLDEEESSLVADMGASLEQLYWRRGCIANKCKGNLDTFHQEYPSTEVEAFLQSGRPAFSHVRLAEWLRTAQKPLFRGEMIVYCGISWATARTDKVMYDAGFRPDHAGRLQIWEEPVENVDYASGWDISEGIETGNNENDDSSVSIINSVTGNVAATWCGKMHPDELADFAANLGTYYNNMYIVAEANNHGLTFLTKLIKQYPQHRIYKQEVGEEQGYTTRTERFGFWTNRLTKLRLMDELAIAIRKGSFHIQDEDCLKELTTCAIDKNGKVDTNGKDRTMGLALAWFAFNNPYVKVLKQPTPDDPHKMYWKEKRERIREGYQQAYYASILTA